MAMETPLDRTDSHVDRLFGVVTGLEPFQKQRRPGSVLSFVFVAHRKVLEKHSKWTFGRRFFQIPTQWLSGSM